MKRYFLISLILYIANRGYCQEYHKKEIDLQSYIEEVFPVQDADLNYEELYESLLLFYSHPLDLNKASKDELRALFILSEDQITHLWEYKEKFGALLSIYELQAVPGFDRTTIYHLLPFVKVENRANASSRSLLGRIWTEPNNYLLLRYERALEEKKGYKENEEGQADYLGPAGKMMARFRVSHARDFSLGFMAEKDAGEPIIFDSDNNTYGADFYSFHFQLQNRGKLKDLIIGDYQVQFGQSLLLDAGFHIGKGAETITTTRRSNLGIRPYTSSIETGFFRGVAGTYQIHKKLDLTTFYSRLEEDASFEAGNTPMIRSIQNSGMHRTRNELAAKDQLVKQSIGGNLLYHSGHDDLQVGAIFITDLLDIPLAPPDELYKRFDFYGSNNFNVGLHANYRWQNVTLFGEAARSKSGGTGAIGGLMASLTPKLSTSLVLRSYDRNFHSFHGNAFAESAGDNRNEKGWYWGLKYSPSRKYQFTAYFDRFMFPWLRYGVDAPSSGYEYLFRANYTPTRSTYINVQYREESKAHNPGDETETQPITSPVNGVKRSYILNLGYSPDEIISFKSKVQSSSYHFAGQLTHGYALIQDFNIELKKLRISTRYALFDTDDYNNRQYAYERDVLYAFSIPPYSGRGTRIYVLIQYKLSHKIDLWIRYARTHYRDRDTISSGLEEIKGNVKTDLKAQIRIRF